MITNIEKAKRLIDLCNTFKDRSKFCNAEFYDYANHCWKLAYETDECELFYEDSGDNSYYDLIGLKIENSYASIPVPLLENFLVADIMKCQPNTVKKYYHNRNVDNINEDDLRWEILIPELVFLSLEPYNSYEHENFFIVKPTDFDKIPKNPVVYGNRGEYSPIYDRQFHQDYSYKGVFFTSWITLKGIFNEKV